jgi:hypothetical protein
MLINKPLSLDPSPHRMGRGNSVTAIIREPIRAGHSFHRKSGSRGRSPHLPATESRNCRSAERPRGRLIEIGGVVR